MKRITDLTAYSKTTIADLSEFIIDDYNSGTVTMTNANPCVATYTAHGLVENNIVVFTTTGALPTNVVASTNYYVTSVTTNTFQFSATLGGTPIDSTSGTQSGVQTVTFYVSRKISGSQVKAILGNNAYSVTLTPGTVSVANTITHSLNTVDIVVELWDTATGEQILATIGNKTTTTVDITFNSNPSSTVRVVVLAKGGFNSDLRPYKVLSGLLNQTGVNVPTLTILENTIGGTPVFSYISVGAYHMTMTGAFTLNKTFPTMSLGSGPYNKNYQIFRQDANIIYLVSISADTPTNGVFTDFPIEIRVYN